MGKRLKRSEATRIEDRPRRRDDRLRSVRGDAVTAQRASSVCMLRNDALNEGCIRVRVRRPTDGRRRRQRLGHRTPPT